jgi:hypothetical protein
MILLFVAGSVLGAAGLLALGFGIPIKDTTFGSTMLLSSMVLLCTSLLLVGLGLVVRELKAVVRALAQGGVRAAPRGQPGRPGGPPRPALAWQAGLAPYVDPGAPPLMAEPSFAESQPAAPTVPPPWAAEAATRDRGRNVAGSQPAAGPAPVESPAPPPPERPARRNLLFATRKRDRAEAAGGASSDQPASPELPRMAAPVLPPMPALEAEPKTSFESAWPASSRNADPFARRGRPAAAAASPAPAAEPAAVEPTPPPLPAAEAAPTVTVIKSGVVDGMAYSLYSDGSIEAQMPEGMLRFASLDALRAHLEQRP